MGDAEIIPLGTRGRPGRGSGRQRPSAAARNLASGSSPHRTPPQRTSAEPDADAPDAVDATESRAESATASPAAGGTARARVRAVGSDDHGIPIGDWMAAIQTGAREIWGESWEPELAGFLAFLRRRVTGEYDVDEFGFDAELTERFLLAVCRPIAEKWFRVEVRGEENIPRDGGALIVSNHSGTVPVDGLMTMAAVHDRTGRHLRALGADLVFQLPFVGSLARKGGATLACTPDAERMLANGELVGVWPEGFKGIGKPFAQRYKLQRFGRGGFVSAALRTGVPIVPLSVVGAEEIYPLVGNVPALARLLGLPYLPITPTFPLLGPLGLVPLPSKWLLEFGEPIRTDDYQHGADEDPMLVFSVTDQVRETIQQTLYALLRERGSVFGG